MTAVTVQVVQDGEVEVVEVAQAGPPGSAATVAVGTVTTLAPGSSATVANAGTSSAAVLNFGVPRGATGEAGPQGDPGPQGPAGADSTVPGPAGPAGADGADGTDGATILSGSGAPSAGIGNDGDVYVGEAAGAFYGPKAAGAWGTPVSLQGPQGPAGDAGPQGPQGDAGATGSQGPAGADGKTLRNGAGAPSAGLGVDGDFYIDTAADTIYGPKSGGSWGSPTSIVGPQGDTGATGAQGPQGETGAAGPQGATGPQGPAGGLASRSTASATINLANGATGTTTITLPKSAILFSIQIDKAALVVLYSSAAAATADAGRAWATVAPTAGAGVIAQVTLAAAGTQQLDPPPSAVNREGTPSTTYTIRVTNNGTTGDVVVTMGYTTLEP